MPRRNSEIRAMHLKRLTQCKNAQADTENPPQLDKQRVRSEGRQAAPTSYIPSSILSAPSLNSYKYTYVLEPSPPHLFRMVRIFRPNASLGGLLPPSSLTSLARIFWSLWPRVR